MFLLFLLHHFFRHRFLSLHFYRFVHVTRPFCESLRSGTAPEDKKNAPPSVFCTFLQASPSYTESIFLFSYESKASFSFAERQIRNKRLDSALFGWKSVEERARGGVKPERATLDDARRYCASLKNHSNVKTINFNIALRLRPPARYFLWCARSRLAQSSAMPASHNVTLLPPPCAILHSSMYIFNKRAE